MTSTHRTMTGKDRIVALLTDFGTHDQYVGVMKGVMLSSCPSLRFIDLSHDVQAGNMEEGAYLLWASYKYLPAGTVFGAVVDPGVGSSRQIVLAETSRQRFVAPHNGILDFVLWEEKVSDLTVFDPGRPASRRLIPGKISSTFHGRDIVAPICAYLANGGAVSGLGRKVPVHKIAAPFYSGPSATVDAKILHVDRFGNIITNISGDLRTSVKALKIGSATVDRWVKHYAEASPRSASLIIGSSGLVEVIIKDGNAAASLLRRKKTKLSLLR